VVAGGLFAAAVIVYFIIFKNRESRNYAKNNQR
jgi:hypothetical protein